MFHNTQSLGIDLRDNRIRLACLTLGHKQARLLSYADIPLPDLKEGTLSEYEHAFNKSLRDFISKNRIKAESVVVGLPLKEALFRTIELPRVKTEEIRQILGFEIERHIPFGAAETVFDFQFLRNNENNKTEIAFVAAKKERINYLLSLLDSAGVKYSSLEIAAHAHCGAFYQEEGRDPAPRLFIDLGRNELEFFIEDKGKLVFCHHTGRNARSILGAPAPAPDPQRLEEISAAMSESEQALAARLSGEIHTVLLSLQKRHNTPPVQGICLSGSEASEALAEYIRTAASREVEIWDPAQSVETGGVNVSLSEGGAVVGLALQGMDKASPGFNLIPLEEQTLKKENRFLLPIVLGGLLTLLLAATGASHLIKDRLVLQKINEEINALKPQLAQVQKITARERELKSRLAGLEQLAREDVGLLNILKELTNRLPPEAWLTSLNSNQKELEIGGYATAASNLIPLLEDSPYFKDVQFTSTITSGRDGSGKEKFKLKIQLVTGREKK